MHLLGWDEAGEGMHSCLRKDVEGDFGGQSPCELVVTGMPLPLLSQCNGEGTPAVESLTRAGHPLCSVSGMGRSRPLSSRWKSEATPL